MAKKEEQKLKKREAKMKVEKKNSYMSSTGMFEVDEVDSAS